MAQIVFVLPKGLRPPLYPHVGVLYLAALVRENYSVKIIDRPVAEDPDAELRAALGEETVCVGLTALTGLQITDALKTAALVRSVSRTVPIVWGGVHATLDPKGTLAHGLVDVVCRGEGETVFPALVRALERKEDLRRVPGIGFKENGKAVFTPMPEKYFDLDALPLLPYGLVDFGPYNDLNFSSLFSPPTHPIIGFRNKAIGGLETGRGCPYRCSYCLRAVRREPLRSMSAESAVRHLVHMRASGIGSVEILNDNFLADRDWARDFLEAARGSGMEFYLNVRADSVLEIDDGILERMEKAGVVGLGIGAESGSDDTLTAIDKRSGSRAVREANARLRGRGIMPVYSYLIGFPDETPREAMRTYRAMIGAVAGNPNAKVLFQKVFPPPGTPLYERCVQKGMEPRRSLEDWAGVMDLEWRRREAYTHPGVERWVSSTRYFRELVTMVWMLRSPYGSVKRTLFRLALMPVFYLGAAAVLLRARLGWTGPGPDTWAGALLERIRRGLRPRRAFALGKIAEAEKS